MYRSRYLSNCARPLGAPRPCVVGQWEQKTTDVGSGANLTDPHDVDNVYGWRFGAAPPVGDRRSGATLERVGRERRHRAAIRAVGAGARHAVDALDDFVERHAVGVPRNRRRPRPAAAGHPREPDVGPRIERRRRVALTVGGRLVAAAAARLADLVDRLRARRGDLRRGRRRRGTGRRPCPCRPCPSTSRSPSSSRSRTSSRPCRSPAGSR